MVDKQYTQTKVSPSHPGSILRSGFIDEYDLPIETVASLLGIARGHLSRILNTHSPITPSIALKLEFLTETPASQWLAMQSKYDAFQMEQDQAFKNYEQTIRSWRSNSLLMPPQQRRQDVQNQELIKKVSALAKQMNSRVKLPE